MYLGKVDKERNDKLRVDESFPISEHGYTSGILDRGTHSILLMKLKFARNKAILDIVNKGADTMIFKPGEVIGIIDFKIIRVLQDQTRNTATELKQVL